MASDGTHSPNACATDAVVDKIIVLYDTDDSLLVTRADGRFAVNVRAVREKVSFL